MFRRAPRRALLALSCIALAACSDGGTNTADKVQPGPGSGLRTSESYYAMNSEAGWYRPGAAPQQPEAPPPQPAAAPAPKKVAEAPPPAPVRTSANGLAIPTGDRSTSSLWVEKLVPSEVVAGSPFEYEIRATNLTGIPLDNVTVWDTIPSNFKVASMNPQGQIGPQGTTWSLGTLGPRESKSVKVMGAASGVGTVNSCAGGSFSTALCTAINVVQPAIRVTRAIPTEATVCDTVPVKLTVTNTGTGAARNVRVTDTLASGLKTADGRASAEFNAGTLIAGQSREFTYTIKAAKPGTYAGSAQAVADGDLKASSSESSTTFTQATLAIKIKGPEKLYLGKPITYEITVANPGDTPAAGTVVENPIPSGATFVSASDNGRSSGGSVAWDLGTLAPKASKTLSVTFNYNSIGQVKDTAGVRATCAQAVTASTETEMAGIPALLLDGSDNPDPVQLGDTVVYTLTLTNQGSAPLTNVKLTCTMDEGDTMQYQSSTGASDGATSGRTINFKPVARLEPKQKATYRITVKAAKEGQTQFRAEASSDQITRPLIKVETTNFYK